jgi:hypothetical protein
MTNTNAFVANTIAFVIFTIVKIIESMVKMIDTIVLTTMTQFSETKTIAYALNTLFSITKKMVGNRLQFLDAPQCR